ncbi:MAG TPA: adenylyl-sulfate kinase [Saprospiraceae bacterium]|nr:adenylyl-sulfate kinase [Saprospiraceae bacterium]
MKNIHPIDYQFVPGEEKEIRNGQHAKVFWFTGLSGSGKSTLAIGLERKLFDAGYQVVVLDGDNIRSGLNSNLSFSPEDRKENIRRIAEVAKLLMSNGQVCIVTFITPTIELRQLAKGIISRECFVEVFIDTPIEICESRDVKGLYQKARTGEIKDFTGVNAPYEKPLQPDICIETKNKTVEESLEELHQKVVMKIRW